MAPSTTGEMRAETTAMATRAIFVDDSVLIREGVEALLGDSSDVELLGTCAGPGPAMIAIHSDHPDVVITDLRMGPSQADEGMQLARRIGAELPDVGVIVLSQYLVPEHAIELLDHRTAGRGYMLKDRIHDASDLAAAIRTVDGGGSWVDPTIVGRMLDERRNAPRSRLAGLTERELEVLADIASGLSNRAIAERRVITTRAVEKHATSIFAKLEIDGEGATNRRVKAALIYLAEDG